MKYGSFIDIVSEESTEAADILRGFAEKTLKNCYYPPIPKSGHLVDSRGANLYRAIYEPKVFTPETTLYIANLLDLKGVFNIDKEKKHCELVLDIRDTGIKTKSDERYRFLRYDPNDGLELSYCRKIDEGLLYPTKKICSDFIRSKKIPDPRKSYGDFLSEFQVEPYDTRTPKSGLAKFLMENYYSWCDPLQTYSELLGNEYKNKINHGHNCCPLTIFVLWGLEQDRRGKEPLAKSLQKDLISKNTSS
ncbi:MAG: hypothetical protein NT055_00020 [Nitrospirae bacterium]|nr:hypothetical protein [Nitrospirota bacterium]